MAKSDFARVGSWPFQLRHRTCPTQEQHESQRFDLLRAVQGLAARVTQWSKSRDAALHRLVCYVNSMLDVRLQGFVGDKIGGCKLYTSSLTPVMPESMTTVPHQDVSLSWWVSTPVFSPHCIL